MQKSLNTVTKDSPFYQQMNQYSIDMNKMETDMQQYTDNVPAAVSDAYHAKITEVNNFLIKNKLKQCAEGTTPDEQGNCVSSKPTSIRLYPWDPLIQMRLQYFTQKQQDCRTNYYKTLAYQTTLDQYQ